MANSINQLPNQIVDPTLPKDRLSSKQFLTAIDVLGEGEIGGFPSAIAYGSSQGSASYLTASLKDIYLNKTPVLTANADPAGPQDQEYNFRDVGLDVRFGTSSQTFIKGISEIETEKAVNVLVEKDSPITRSITNTAVTSVRVTLVFPRMEEFEDDGDVIGSQADLQIKVKYSGGSYATVISDKVRGRSSSSYSRDYVFNISGAFPIDIRVERTSDDSNDSKKINAFNWSTYTEIIDQQRPYPDTAHVALRFDAEQFPNIPRRSYKVRGIKVKIPSNATVQADGSLSFSGSWNGTFKTDKETTSCPAWILWDILTNERYGFGQHISESQLDKFTFYSVSQYNNQQVSDGLGGTEPRFAYNGSIQRQTSAFKLINDICSNMRCMPYWANNTLTISQDSPKDSSYIFNLSNVTDGGFSYRGSSVKTRATQIQVSYFDNATQEVDWVEVNDTAMQAKWGIVVKKIKAVGVTSRGQASRLGKWMLYELFNSTETVSFTTTIETCNVACGDVIEISDPVRSGVRRGGRIQASSVNFITVDDSSTQTDLPTTGNPTIAVILPDGSQEERVVSSIVNSVINVTTPFSSAPQINSAWILKDDTVTTTQWRIINITETEEVLYQITALPYHSGKFAYVEDGTALSSRSVSILNAIPSAPSNLSATEQIYEENGVAKVKIITDWSSVAGSNQYRIQWRKANSNWTQETITKTDYEILDTTSGSYEIRVFSYNAQLTPSSTPATLSFSAVGKTAPPADVANLTFEAISANLGRLRWDRSTELDVINGGGIKFKHSSLTDGTGTWSNSVSFIASKNGGQTIADIPLLEGEVLVKFFDDGGRESTNATSVIIDLPDALGSLGVITQREDLLSPTPFPGTKTNVYYDATNTCIALEGETFDGVADVDAIVNFDLIGDISSSGTYNFASQLDLGGVFSLDLLRHFVVEGFFPNNLIDSRIALIDTWGDFDGSNATNVDAKIYVRTTNDNPASSPTWSAWKEFTAGVHKLRAAEFKAILTSGDTDENIRVKQLGYSATLKRRQEQSVGVVASGAGSKTINFSKPFFTGTSGLGGVNAYLPSVNLTVNNLSSGDYIDGPTATSTGFTFTVKNSGGSAIDKNFTWSATGFGLGV
tara:strand:+ start:72 stop:3419 length:3348 start_codon:yes stop_codon:yes gene_type:complete